jgi:hypothetical protein
MVSINLRKFKKRIKYLKFGPYYLVATGKERAGEPLFTFIDGKIYTAYEALALARKYGYDAVERIYEAFNSLG